MNDNFMDQVIGQQSLKRKFAVYSQSFSKTSVNPFFCFTAARGYGKTYMIKEYCRELIDSEGRDRPFIECNAASVKGVDAFMDIWYPKMRDNNGCLFIDECHELPHKVQTMLLTVCNKDTNPNRRYTYDKRDIGEVTVNFHFREYCLFFATTDLQKMDPALQDRFTKLTIAQYSHDELFAIFLQKLGQMNENIVISAHVRPEIISVLRGHPRSSFELAEQIMHFCEAIVEDYVSMDVWEKFRHSMGIMDYGLNDTEMHIIELLGRHGAQSLTDLAAKTECTRSAIQNQFEVHLKKCNLMSVDGKRHLTDAGQTLFRKLYS